MNLDTFDARYHGSPLRRAWKFGLKELRLAANDEHIETRCTEQEFGNDTEIIAAYHGYSVYKYNVYNDAGRRRPVTIPGARQFLMVSVNQPGTSLYHRL